MGTQPDFQQQVIALLTKLKIKKEALQKEFETRIADVDREIESVSTTVRLLREPIQARASDSGMRDTSIINRLMGKTAKEALIAIAKANEGTIRIVDAKQLLIGAGVIKKPKYAWGAIYTTLTRNHEFEKVPNERGTFRIVENHAQTKFPVAS